MGSSLQGYYRNRYSATRGVPQGHEGTFQERIGAMLAALPEAPARVLDFGCNRGAFAAILSGKGYRVVGVDISETAIEVAREAVPDARFATVENEALLPFADGSFDVCVATEVIEHLFDVVGFAREMQRVLVPGGRLLLTTPYHGLVKNLVLVTFGFEHHFNVRGGHIRFFSRRSMTELLHAEGFRVEEIRGIGRFWPVWKTMFVNAWKDAVAG